MTKITCYRIKIFLIYITNTIVLDTHYLIGVFRDDPRSLIALLPEYDVTIFGNCQ